MSDFDHIFKKYHHSLMLYSLKFVESESEALDIVQEVFTMIWENGKYKLEENHLKSYLFNAVRNSCLNYIKHLNVVRTHIKSENYKINELELNHYKSGEKSLIEEEDLQKIYKVIDSLSENYKEVIQLSRFDGLKNSVIAEKLEIPVRTVETRLFRALSKLREKLTQKEILILLNYSVFDLVK